MNEIKFRGKRIDNGKWVYGYLMKKYHNQYWIIVYNGDGYGQEYRYEVIPETVGQYIGLEDKNKVEIYEGDIPGEERVDQEPEVAGVVKYDNDVAAFVIEKTNGGWEHLGMYLNNYRRTIIIGNIHSNPELLEKS